MRDGSRPLDNAFLEEQAERCRTLAEKADPFTRDRLLDLAAKYDDKLGQVSRASRTPRSLLETSATNKHNMLANGLNSEK